MRYVFPPPDSVSLPVMGGGRFPVRRIFCIGRNYADHVREMGGDPKSDPPVFFTKPADAVVESGAVIPYPPSTDNLHYEGELVIALKGAGANLSTRHEAGALIFGAACGCDLTRRDLQAAAKKAGAPWDAAKAFDRSAPVGAIAPISVVSPDAMYGVAVKTFVNDAVRQDSSGSTMIWSAPEIIIALSKLFELRAGDLVFTGTPEGVGPLSRGDRVRVEIGPLSPLEFSIGE